MLKIINGDVYSVPTIPAVKYHNIFSLDKYS